DERAQHGALALELFAAIQEKRELADGYAFRLPPERWLDAARWAALEKKCCPFFAFALRAAPDRGPLWLEVTGRPGAKAFMKAELGLERQLGLLGDRLERGALVAQQPLL